MAGNPDNEKCKDEKCPAKDRVGGHTKAITVTDKSGKKTDCSGKSKS
jgi:hypothetical protein